MPFLAEFFFDRSPSVSHYISPMGGSIVSPREERGDEGAEGDTDTPQIVERGDDTADIDSVWSLDDNGIPSWLVFETAIRDHMRASRSSGGINSRLDDDSFSGQTILSSAPSGVVSAEGGAPPILDGEAVTSGRGDDMILATSPNARSPFASGHHPLSISTAESESIYLPQDDNFDSLEGDRRETLYGSLSLHASLIDSSEILSSTCSSQSSRVTPASLRNFQSQGDTFVRTLALPQQQFSARLPFHPSTQWRLPPLPPMAPTLATATTSLPMTLMPDSACESPASSAVSQWLPPSFVCLLCQEAIVGSVTLDCQGCEQLVTVCTACWEYYNATRLGLSEKPLHMVENLGYSVVHWHRDPCHASCPKCRQPVQSIVYCHALDVAIVQLFLHGLPCSLSDHDSCSRHQFQRRYFDRVNEWRAEVVRRSQEKVEDTEMVQNDFAVAQLLQQDEEELCRFSYATNLVPAHLREVTTLTFVAAFVASVGLRIMAAQSPVR